MFDRLRILIVDDDPLDRETLRRALSRDALKLETFAVDLVEVETLAAARDALGREEFSCIFLDHLLPDGSGLELLIEARNQGIQTPVIVLTGQRDDVAMMVTIEAGAVNYVPKSLLTPEIAVQSVRAAIQFQQVQLEKQAALAALYVRDNAIASASNGIVVSDALLPDCPMIYVNPAFIAMTGYSEKESLGHNCRFLQGPTTSPDAVKELRDAVRNQTRCQTLIQNFKKDGTAFWNEITVSPVRSASGKVTHFVGIQTDVTARQASDTALRIVERQLQETVALLDTLLNTAPVGFAFLDRDLRYRRVNTMLAQLSGMTESEMLGRTLPETLPELAFMENQFLRPALEAGVTHVGVEVKGETPASPNKSRYWLASCYPVDDASARRLGVGIMITEITDRKAAEENLRQFQFISENANDAFFLMDEAGRFMYVNEAAQKSLGYTMEQLREMRVPDVNTQFQGADYGALFQRVQIESIAPLESEHRRADGTTFPIEASVSSLTIEGRALMFASVRDITERRRQQEEMAALYEREHKIAESLQRSLLNKPPASILTGLDVETIYRPAWDEAQVGGDYFDVFALDGGRLALVVGDVSGKGLEAASRTAEIKYTLRAYLREHSDAASALSRLNAFLCESQAMEAGSDEYFVAMTLAIVDSSTGMARIAVAGAEPPILLHTDGTFEEVSVSGMPLGIASKANYLAADVFLDMGDLLLIATDGVTEARQGRQFLGNDGMAHLAAESLGRGSLVEIGKGILEGAKAFASGHLHDDICLLLARRK